MTPAVAAAETVEMTPVDHLARSIAALALAPRKELLVANLSNPATLSLRAFFAALAGCGFTAKAEPPAEWQKRLASIGEENALSQIKDFYTGDLSAAPLPVEQTATLAALGALGVGSAPSYEILLPLYLNYFKAEGFLK